MINYGDKMVSGVECDKGKIIEAIHLKEGIIERAAKFIGINPKTIYAWIKKDEDVAKALEEAREYNRLRQIDEDEEIGLLAYTSMQDLLRQRDVTATIFSLKCKKKWSDKAGDAVQSTITKTEVINYHKPSDD